MTRGSILSLEIECDLNPQIIRKRLIEDRLLPQERFAFLF
jgi:hypothetical protein